MRIILMRPTPICTFLTRAQLSSSPVVWQQQELRILLQIASADE